MTSTNPYERSRLAGRVAAIMLALGLLIGGLAYAFRDDPDAGPGASPGTGTAEGPTGSDDEAKKPRKRYFPGPAKDPRTGRDFCTTVTLLGRYAETDYGLDDTGKVVSGRDFDRRLVVIAGTYRRLAVQAAAEPGVRGTAQSWLGLARATERAEETLRAAGLQVQSQPMVVSLAKLAKTSSTLLPAATDGLSKTCGIDPGHLGVPG